MTHKNEPCFNEKRIKHRLWVIFIYLVKGMQVRLS